MSGGGSKGAYEAGAVYALMHNLTSPENQYDVLCGVSAGSMNAMSMALWDYGQEYEMADFMVGVWQNITNAKVYRDWPDIDPLHGLLYEAGYFDNSPLEKTLLDYKKGRTVMKPAIVSSNDAHSGVYLGY